MNKETLEFCALAICDLVTGETASSSPNLLNDLSDEGLLRLITLGQFVTDICINELERRGKLEISPEGIPTIPYMSNHAVETILTREELIPTKETA